MLQDVSGAFLEVSGGLECFILLQKVFMDISQLFQGDLGAPQGDFKKFRQAFHDVQWSVRGTQEQFDGPKQVSGVFRFEALHPRCRPLIQDGGPKCKMVAVYGVSAPKPYKMDIIGMGKMPGVQKLRPEHPKSTQNPIRRLKIQDDGNDKEF